MGEVEKLCRVLCKRIDGILGIAISSYDGLPLLKVMNPDQTKGITPALRGTPATILDVVRTKYAHKFSSGTQQVANVGLGKLRTCTMFYKEYVVFQMTLGGGSAPEKREPVADADAWPHPIAPILSVLLSSDADLSTLRSFVPNLTKALQDLAGDIERFEKQDDDEGVEGGAAI
eukprot:g5187.t1